jgi:hypothetical protein
MPILNTPGIKVSPPDLCWAALADTVPAKTSAVSTVHNNRFMQFSPQNGIKIQKIYKTMGLNEKRVQRYNSDKSAKDMVSETACLGTGYSKFGTGYSKFGTGYSK